MFINVAQNHEQEYLTTILINTLLFLRRMIPDTRNTLWRELEVEIQSRAKKKDHSFRLTGSWKKFLRKESSYKIYVVNGKWIRNNLCAYFTHGGHGFVHEFIPLDEIWIETHHPSEGINEMTLCPCKVKKKGQNVSKNFFESTILHEITEYELMKKGINYWVAHHAALQKEREVGLIKDPYDDT